tara:strand:- start:6666 stop:6884 length:219 start_codon:yes stop_codon:yes gene_type:complete
MNKKYHFTCYLCEEECKNRNKGGVIGNYSDLNPKIICEKCVHNNYCWATDRDLTEHTYQEMKSNRFGLFQNY